MSTPRLPWLTNEERDLVRDFWQRTGRVETFPRPLESVISLALPVQLVKIPNLTLHKAESWIRARSADFTFACASRDVCGCMAAQRGQGFIFVDPNDAEDDLRFTLAHEVGHFLADVLAPREKALQAFGPRIREVIDGERRPTLQERFASIMTGLPLARQSDFLDRSGSGVDAFRTWKVEDRADRVGLALLAPPEAVLASVERDQNARTSEGMTRLLCEDYGLPPLPAQRYAEQLKALTHRYGGQTAPVA